jgi:hypothetical protein
MRNAPCSRAVLLSLVACAPLAAAPATPSSFIRIERNNAREPVALQTAVAHYVPAAGAGGVTVDLIGAIHVGDRAYYERLNKLFEEYDVVLYELVAPPGTRIPKGGRRAVDNPLALIHQLAKTVLDLESQMEQIDYTKKNLVHADLSPQQMAEAIKNRGDDAFSLFLGIASDLLRQQNVQQQTRDKQPTAEEMDFDPLALLLDPAGPAKLKRTFAEQLVEFSSPAGGLGRTLGTILVADRNAAAMKVLQAELARGRKKIAIFYGVAHLPDFDQRLRADFGLKRDREQWLTAWDLRARRKGLGDFLKLLEP